MNTTHVHTMGLCEWVVLPIILLVAVLLTSGCSSDPPAAEPRQPAAESKTGKTPAPATATGTLAAFIEQHELAGRVALIEFGRVGCENSDKGLDRMIRMHRERLLPKLACVRVEGAAAAPAVDKYHADKAAPFPVHRDADAALAKALDATVIPTFVLMDKFQRVRYRGRFPGEQKVIEWAEVLLAEKTDPGPKPPRFGTRKLDIPRLLAATKLPSLHGPVQPLQKYMGRGGLVAVFTDTRCPYSAQAVGDLPDVARVLKTHGINTVMINIDDPESAVRKYSAKHRVPTPVLYDATAATKNLWNVQSVPTVVYIDAKDKLRYNGKAVWAHLALIAERTLALQPGALKFTPKGTGFG